MIPGGKVNGLNLVHSGLYSEGLLVKVDTLAPILRPVHAAYSA